MNAPLQRSVRNSLLNLLLTLLLATVSSLTLAAPADGGIADLQASLAGKVIGVDAAPVQIARPGAETQATVSHLLASPSNKAPLSANTAVRIALLNNPDLQQLLGQEATDLSDRALSEAPAKLRARQAITTLSAQAFKAWVNAVASSQSVAHLREAQATAQTRNELARRMVQVGNLSKLAQAQYQAELSEAALATARGAQATFAAREKLTRVLGVWGPQAQYTLPDALEALPAQPLNLPGVEAQAVQARADLAVARNQWNLKQRSSVPTSADDLWDALGDAAKVRGMAVKVRSEAREAYFNYRSTFDIAHHMQTEVLPLRKFINDELMLRYNGMLTSLFDALADSQTQTLAANASVAAQRDFWLAHADLQAVLAGAPLAADASTKDTP
jgi:multidrug efflux system outer membrane protein